MTLKKFALRGLIILLVVVALCMFFARTVQTITTPKVRITQASQGRLEQKVTLRAKIHFPDTEDFSLDQATKTSITVDKVYVKPGHYVEAGEIIFTAKMPSYEDDLKKLQEEYNQKAQDLIDLDITNRKLSKQSKQNDLYDAMLDGQDALSEVTQQARAAAMAYGITLVGDVTTWEKQLNALSEVPSEVQLAVTKALAAKKTFDDARTEFFNVYENKTLKVSSETFEYINSRNALIKQMDELDEDITALCVRNSDLTTVRATRAGYIVSVNVNEGDVYDGIRAAYTMNAVDTLPVLRADVTDQERSYSDGTKVEISLGEYETAKTSVEKTATQADGTKYLYITLPESMQQEGSSQVRRIVQDEGIDAVITYRAKTSTTLIPPSALRSEGDNYYVYTVETNYGGFMGSTSMKVVKTNVTVIEKSDKAVSIQEDLYYVRIADQEDRAINDGDTVMEYVN